MDFNVGDKIILIAHDSDDWLVFKSFPIGSIGTIILVQKEPYIKFDNDIINYRGIVAVPRSCIILYIDNKSNLEDIL